MLEVNTVPGMTSHSLLPKAAKLINIDYDEVVEIIVKKQVVLIIVFCLVNQISANNGIEINFLNKVSQSQKTQIIAIAHQNTHSLSKSSLQSIEWIETFEIQKTIFGKTLLQISAKIPLLVLNDTFFVDKSMNFYEVHEFEDDLLRVNCPEYLFKDIFYLINNVQEILNFSLKTINYDVIEGVALAFRFYAN